MVVAVVNRKVNMVESAAPVKFLSADTLVTPRGTFGAVFSERGLCRLAYPGEPLDLYDPWLRRVAPGAARVAGDARLRLLQQELSAYFEGGLQQFTVPVHLLGTPFQVQVWTALQDIAYGELRTYAQVAAAVGRPAAVRAVGAANGANPVPIVVPCHRVIGANGMLTGYGGGLEMKTMLLKREGILMGML